MTVDRKAIDAMANIMSILNQKTAEDDAYTGEMITEGYLGSDVYDPTPSDYVPEPTHARPTSIGSPDTEAMKEVLLRLQNLSESAAPAQDGMVDHELKEALVTVPTPRGARIGSWEIIKNQGKLPTYDVVSADGSTTIAKDLYVYEAAYGLTKVLNKGVPINDSRVTELLRLEESFVTKRNDAEAYKQRAKKFRESGEDHRANVAEDRHDDVARQAQQLHEDILRLAGRHR